MFTCLKFLDGLTLSVFNMSTCSESSGTLLVKSNAKTLGYFQEIKDLKRQEYLDFVRKKAKEDEEEVPKEQELIESEQLNDALTNGLLAYEKEMITGGHKNYEHIVGRLSDILEALKSKDGNAENPEGKSQRSESRANSEEVKAETDALLKFREHEREKHREKKVKQMEQDRKIKFTKRLNELNRWEQQRDRDNSRERYRL